MGMFDYIDYECICPVCRDKLSVFQSKDKYAPECRTFKPQDVDNFYTSCNKCGCRLEFYRVDKEKFRRTVKGKVNKLMGHHTKILTF